MRAKIKSTGKTWTYRNESGSLSGLTKKTADDFVKANGGTMHRTPSLTGSGRRRPWAGCGGRETGRTRLERIAAAFGEGYGVRGCIAVKVADSDRIEIYQDGYSLSEMHADITAAGAREQGLWLWGFDKRLESCPVAF